MAVDEALPRVASGPRSLPLSGELAGRIAKTKRDGALPEARGGSTPERKHRRLPRDRRAELHRPAGRNRTPHSHRNVHRSAHRGDPRRRAHRGRPTEVLPPNLRRPDVVRLAADPGRYQGTPGGTRRVPAPPVYLLGRGESRRRAPPERPASAGVDEPPAGPCQICLARPQLP